MGSSLAPVLANLFMGHHERIWLQQYDGPAIYFYCRYVDDTFCLFNNEKDALEFFQYINDKHPSIRFTMETEVKHKLPFLDVLLAPVVQRLDNAIHQINHYPVDSVVCFVNTYPLDSHLSGG